MSYRDGLPHAIRVIGKGNKEREVVLSATAQRALVQWLKPRKLEGHPTSAVVWSNLSGRQRGQAFKARTVQKMPGTVAQRAGLAPERVSPHKLRHSYATALVEHGRTIDEVRDLLGHESIATTQIYAAVSRRRLEEAARSLPDVL